MTIKYGRILITVLLSGFVCGGLEAEPFFETDVWKSDERPFLFYGETKPPVKPTSQDLTTVSQLRERVKETLERAVMNPSEDNIAAYLEVNALLFKKAGLFAEKWRDTLLRFPQYDWTATHPTVNAASTTLLRERDEARTKKLLTLKKDWGLVFFGDKGRLTGLMRPLVDRFAALFGFELVKVAVGGPTPYMSRAYVDVGYAARAAGGGLKLFPALLLMHRGDRGLEDGRLVATGVVDVTEIGRRIVRLVEQHERKEKDKFLRQTDMPQNQNEEGMP